MYDYYWNPLLLIAIKKIGDIDLSMDTVQDLRAIALYKNPVWLCVLFGFFAKFEIRKLLITGLFIPHFIGE